MSDRAARRLAGKAAYWVAWPLYQVYFRLSERTRVVVVHNGRVLAMQQWIGSGRWSLPGGGLHRGEPPADGAVRELYEETGIRVATGQLEYLGVQQYRQHGQRFVFHVFACALPDLPLLRRQWYEVSVLEWLPIDAFTPQTATNDALQSVQLVQGRTDLLQ